MSNIAALVWAPLSGPETAEVVVIEGYECRTWVGAKGSHHFVVLKGVTTIAKGSHSGTMATLVTERWPLAGWWWGEPDDGLERFARMKGRALSKVLCELAVFNETSRRVCEMRKSLTGRLAEMTEAPD